MPLCAVQTCKFGVPGHNEDIHGIIFHPFPKSGEVRGKWIDMTGRNTRDTFWEPENTDTICSRHFRDCDYTVKRSGKKYLKTSALPCEYVVYPLSLFVSDEESSDHEQSNDTVVKEEQSDELQSEEEEIVDPHRPGFFYQMHKYGKKRENEAPLTRAPRSQEPDSTLFDTDNSYEPWDRYSSQRNFGGLLPFFDETTQDVGSSGFDDRFLGEVGSAINPYPPVDLGPHLQQLPLPRTPEPPIIDEDTQDSVAGSAASMRVAYSRNKAKLDSIKKIISKRKTSKKLSAAVHAVVEEAKSLNAKLQTGVLNDQDMAPAVIAILHKQIAKQDALYKKLRKKLKKISAVLREE